MDRVVTWASAVAGVLQLSSLGPYDAELFDGDRLARDLTIDLFVGWGAARDEVEAADRIIDELRAAGPLAPRLPSPAPRLTDAIRQGG